MHLTKIQFAFVLLAVFVLPFFLYRIAWLINSAPAAGTMCFMGKTLNGQMSTTYPVIRFSSNGRDTVFFNGADEAVFKPGDPVPVRYCKNNPADARIKNFTGIWLDSFIYALFPFIMLVIVFLHPDIMPRGSIIIISSKPFLRLGNSR